MRTLSWPAAGGAQQLAELTGMAREPGLLLVSFAAADPGPPLAWTELEPWTRSRAVTVADINATQPCPALEVALTADLVYLREQVELVLPDSGEPLTAGLLWAMGRAGRTALARGLLDPGPVSPAEALRLGLVQGVIPPGEPLPLPEDHSLPALTAARDLMRAGIGGVGKLQLELATFRLLFAAGDPEEGARAFLERRPPRFDGSG